MHADSSTTTDATPASAGHQLRTLVLGDPADSWRAAGFDVDATGRLRLGSTTLVCNGAGEGFVGWALDSMAEDAVALDGLALIRDGVGDTAPAVPDTHPNGIVSIDHVVVRTGDCARTIAAFEAAGLEVRGGRSTTSYGAPMRQTFFWAGDVILELVGPDAGEPTTEEPTSIFGLALVASDLDATASSLGDLMGTPKAAVQEGRRIAGLRGATVGIHLPVAVMSPHVRPS